MYITPPYSYFLFHIFLKTPATAKGDYPYEAVSSGTNSIINLIPETWPSSIREAPPIITAHQSHIVLQEVLIVHIHHIYAMIYHFLMYKMDNSILYIFVHLDYFH